jgi:hypothetical protein
MYRRSLILAATVLLATAGFGFAQTDRPEEQSAPAPAKHVVAKHGRGGAYFAPADLQERYDGLLARVEALRATLDRADPRPGDPSPSAVAAELATIETELESLQAKIERRTVFVTPFAVHTKMSVQEIPLQDSRLVVVKADAVKLRGWEGPGIRITMEKSVLWPKDDPAPPDSVFDAIKADYSLGAKPELVGATAAERAAQEQAFLASPEGTALTAEQAKSRAEFLASIGESNRIFERFQGQAVHAIELTGLSGATGNEWVSYKIESPEGGGAFGGDWQRHATLTIELPPVTAVAVLGCQVGFQIQDVAGDVILTQRESDDRDYAGSFVVDGITGNLVTEQVPLDRVRRVSGDVSIEATSVMENSGTHHGPNGRQAYVPPPRPTTIEEIGGRLTANFLRSNLTLAGIASLNVRNDYGTTRFDLSKLATKETHRLISRSGTIEVVGPLAAWEASPPLNAYTEGGTIETNLPQKKYEVVNFGGGGPGGRSWRGLVPVSSDDAPSFFQRSEQPVAIETDAPRAPGFDCLSHAGAVVLRMSGSDR